MASLSVLSWNIEHFNGGGGIHHDTRAVRRDRVERVAAYLKDEDPDIFGLSEVEGKTVFDTFTRTLPGYTFSITEGRQSQEILIGVRAGLTSFFTQRNEFKRSNPYLRPGALLTVTLDGTDVPILFVHLKSLPSPEGFGLRDAMFDKIFGLRRALDRTAREISGGSANFIVVGDMNTMGMDYEGGQHDIAGPEEIRVVTSRFGRRGLRSLRKSHPFTFNNGSGSSLPHSELDHVFAARHLEFAPVDGSGEDGAEVRVGGWALEETQAAQDRWIRAFSDHTPLKFTVTGL